MKKTLTDRGLRATKPAGKGATYDVMDTVVPGFGVRVSETGRRTFVLVARFPGKAQPTRRALGSYGEITLEQARAKAREWLELIHQGEDPRRKAERDRLAAIRSQANTFGAVAEEYITRKIAKTAKAKASELEIRNELIARWGRRPIAEVTRRDVVAMAEEVGERAPYQAHNVFGHARALFNWTIARGLYGLESSPCDRLKPADLIGRKEARSRVLSDEELSAIWKAAERLGYPYGPLFRLLAITGQRKSEVAEAIWPEIDLAERLWVIPGARMKADAPRAVPLSGMALDVLHSLPRFRGGDYLFSTRFGGMPVSGFSKAKARLDMFMAAELAMSPAAFVLHDIRRRGGILELGVKEIPWL